jgi:PPK2 family polyphosphate:nucleotide phosphotransferase
MGSRPPYPSEIAEAVRFAPGDALADRDPGDRSLAVGDRAGTEVATAAILDTLDDWQERLYAAGTAGSTRSVLLLLQGMDTSGKDGTVRRVIGAMDPAGVRITSFKKPTEEELAHDFLWRIDRAMPTPGETVVFNRSQYEDVLVVRVHSLAPEAEWGTRYDRINEFEAAATAAGCHLVKVMLHISPQEQKERLAARLEDPTKHWKYNPGDLHERSFWDHYQAAYQDALSRCTTEHAPWHVVPADRKWYRDWIVANLLADAFTRIDPQYPPAHFDVEEQRRLVAALE